MTGRRSRDQGARIERGIVRALMAQGFAAVRVPLSGVAGGRFAGDVVMPHDPSGVRVCTGRVYRRQLPDELRNEARDPEHCPLFGPLAGCLLRLRSFRLSRGGECERLVGNTVRFRSRLHLRGWRRVDRNRHHSYANRIRAPSTFDVLQENIESDPRRADKFTVHSKIALRRECRKLDKLGSGHGDYGKVSTLLTNRPEAFFEALRRIEILRIRSRKVTQNRIIPGEICVIYCEKDVAHERDQLFRARKRFVHGSSRGRRVLHRCNWRTLRYSWRRLDRNRAASRRKSGLAMSYGCFHQRYRDG